MIAFYNKLLLMGCLMSELKGLTRDIRVCKKCPVTKGHNFDKDLYLAPCPYLWGTRLFDMRLPSLCPKTFEHAVAGAIDNG